MKFLQQRSGFTSGAVQAHEKAPAMAASSGSNTVWFMRQRGGFTLIELLVVIAIIGLLASVVMASLNAAREKGRIARRAADMQQVQLALELYYDSNSAYPPHVTEGSERPIPQELVSSGFLPSVPHDPQYDAPGDNDYRYYNNSGACTNGASTCYHILVPNHTDKIEGVSTDWCDIVGGYNNGNHDDCPF